MIYKFYIPSRKHSEIVQKALFKLGYGWAYGGKNVQLTEQLYLIVRTECSTITYASNRASYNNQKGEEAYIKDGKIHLIKDIVFEDDETPFFPLKVHSDQNGIIPQPVLSESFRLYREFVLKQVGL